jgi:hypothetical protein
VTLERALVFLSAALSAMAGSACSGTVTPAAAACAPSDASFTAPEFVPAPQSTGACTTAAIADFIAACGISARNAILTGGADTCTAWMASNLAGACGTCLVNADNNGAILVDVSGLYPISNWLDAWIATNSFACSQLLTGDDACSSTGIALVDCENAACDLSCGYIEYSTIQGDFPDCVTTSTASGRACAASYAAARASCEQFADDAGDLDLPASCHPIGGANGSFDAGDTTLAFIANLICGSSLGADAGPDAASSSDVAPSGSPP